MYDGEIHPGIFTLNTSMTAEEMFAVLLQSDEDEADEALSEEKPAGTITDIPENVMDEVSGEESAGEEAESEEVSEEGTDGEAAGEAAEEAGENEQ